MLESEFHLRFRHSFLLVKWPILGESMPDDDFSCGHHPPYDWPLTKTFKIPKALPIFSQSDEMTEKNPKSDETPKKEEPAHAKKETAHVTKEKSHGTGHVAKGDIITIEYDAWIVNPDKTEELFDTTSEEHAKAGEIFNEKTKYGPIATVAGDGRVLAGLDKSFVGADVGKKITISIPPSEGAGDRQPNLVEIHSIRELQRQKVDPEPGMRVTMKNKVGTITAVTSGRVRIDFNDPLAGKTVKYEYKVIKKAETPEEKAQGLIDASYGRGAEFKVEAKGDALDIITPDICKYDNIWFTLKYKVVSDLRNLLEYKTIRFVEEYVKKEEEKDEHEHEHDHDHEQKGGHEHKHDEEKKEEKHEPKHESEKKKEPEEL